MLLTALDQAPTSAINWERVLFQLIERGLRGGQVDQASLMLWDHREQALRIKVALNLPQAIVATTRKKAGEMIAGWVFQTRRPLLLSDDISLDPVKQSMRRSEIASALCIALDVRDKTVGVLNLNRLRGSVPFSADDFEMMSLLCHQAAISIEHVYLCERLAGEERLRLNQERFLSPRVAQTIAARRSAVEISDPGRETTVLVTDIRGSTGLGEKTEAQPLVRVLNEYFAAMTGIILAHQGVVDEWSGDALLATFDRSMTHGQDAQQAVRAGLTMLAKLKTLRMDWLNRGLPTFDIGIGISTGMITTGCIGSAKRMAFVTMGKPINMASRIEKLTKTSRVSLIIAQSTFEKVQVAIQYRPLGSMVLDGLSEPVRLYSIYGLKESSDRMAEVTLATCPASPNGRRGEPTWAARPRDRCAGTPQGPGSARVFR